jgi:cytochrome c-type biogenesis protein CcmF
MMQEKRGMLKIWNMWLIFSTFLLCIFGTFLTRSGVVSSVHAFAQSGIGVWFVTFLAIIFAVCVFFFALNKSHLTSENRLESLVSRESSFLFNNLILLVACFTVLWGTLFPVLSEWVQGHKITVGPPFFNKVMIPVALLLTLLTAVGPLFSWRKTSVDSLRRNLLVPGLISLAVGVFIVGMGWVRPWSEQAQFYSWMTIVLAVLVCSTVTSEFLRGARVIATQTGRNLLASTYVLTRRNTRRYGGYIAHFGFAMVLIGFAGSAFNQDIERQLGNGESMNLGPYTMTCRTYTQDDNANFASTWAIVDISRNGKPVGTLFPERRIYKASSQPSTMPAVLSSMREDLYLVYTGSDQDSGQPIIRAHLNPLVKWIWMGVTLLLAGTILAMVPSMATNKIRVPARETAIADDRQVVGAGD